MSDIQETIDFETYRLFAMYADGVQVADIADSFGVSVNTIYKRLNEFPQKYAEAKKRLAKKRNAKYRRIGALASDIQLQTLENSLKLFRKESEWIEELEKLQSEWDEKNYEYYYKHLYDEDETDKDGNVTKAIEIDADTRKKINKLVRRIGRLKKLIQSAEDVRGKIKDISAVGENSERRADLNEGKATDRIVNVGIEPTKEEWEEFWKAQREAGNGLDTESIQT